MHFSVYKNCLSQTETMVASQKQRQPNQKRIKSKTYVAKVLPPSQHSQFGVPASLEVPDIQMGEPDEVEPMMLVDDVSVGDLQATLENVSTQLPVQPGPSAASSSYQLNFQVTTQALSDPQIPQQASVEKQLKKRSLQKKGVVSPDNFTILPSGCKRRCRLCMDAGWDGSDCPGSGNRSRCIYK